MSTCTCAYLEHLPQSSAQRRRRRPRRKIGWRMALVHRRSASTPSRRAYRGSSTCGQRRCLSWIGWSRRPRGRGGGGAREPRGRRGCRRCSHPALALAAPHVPRLPRAQRHSASRPHRRRRWRQRGGLQRRASAHGAHACPIRRGERGHANGSNAQHRTCKAGAPTLRRGGGARRAAAGGRR